MALACCAFAVFLLSQILLPLRKAARWLGFATRDRTDQAVMWVPAPAVAAPSAGAGPAAASGTDERKLPRRRIFAFAIMGEVLAVALLAQTGALTGMPWVAPEGTQAAAVDEAAPAAIGGAAAHVSGENNGNAIHRD